MYYPEVTTDLDGVDHAKATGTVIENYLENARAQSRQRFGVVRFFALGSDGERGQGPGLHLLGELLEILARGLHP